MQTTSNLGLKKPDQNEYVNVEDLNYNVDEIDKLGAPEFDDSGAVSGITSFPAYLTTLMSGTNFFTFFRNLKAGLKFVLHTGQLVNNGQTTEPGFALDARYGKTLADAITQLNANLSLKAYMEFTYNPADWIPASGGFSFDAVSISNGGNHIYAPPTTTSADITSQAWWNVLTFGVENRCTQIAVYAFQWANNGGLIYIRRVHDSWVSGWDRII